MSHSLRSLANKQTSPIFNCVTPVSVSLATHARQLQRAKIESTAFVSQRGAVFAVKKTSRDCEPARLTSGCRSRYKPAFLSGKIGVLLTSVSLRCECLQHKKKKIKKNKNKKIKQQQSSSVLSGLERCSRQKKTG